MCPVLQWGRGWAWEPTHDIAVDVSSGGVILLATELFTVGKEDLQFGESGGYEDVS